MSTSDDSENSDYSQIQQELDDISFDKQYTQLRDYFNIGVFNKEFDKMIERSRIENEQRDKRNLQGLDKVNYYQNPALQSWSEILGGVSKIWFRIINDWYDNKLDSNTFTEDNGLFYIGVSLILIVLLILIINLIVKLTTMSDNKQNQNVSIV